MMKKYLCVAAAIILYSFSFAQEDSLKVIKNDTLAIAGALAIDTSVKNVEIKQQVYKLKAMIASE